MAENPIVICRVRALYPFQSTDQSSLCFRKGDIIEVLSQLESGWWDGWSNGQRGWFPSNYVEIIEDTEPVCVIIHELSSTNMASVLINMLPCSSRRPHLPVNVIHA
jgi:hypothetical protein